MGFLRRTKKLLAKLGVNETVLMPAIVEGTELLLLLVRKSEKFFDLVVVSTDPKSGLQHHAVNAAASPPAIHFRTCMVVPDVEKKLALDDVFWSAVFNLTVRSVSKDSTGDIEKFYDVLIPFITGKPLEQSLIDTEVTLAGSKGPWRAPQRSSTAYVRCVEEALNYLLLGRGLTQLEADQVNLAVQAQLVDFIANDIQHVLPDDNGLKVCEMALSTFSSSTVRLAEAEAKAKAGGEFAQVVPEATRQRVQALAADLARCVDDAVVLQPFLDLAGPKADAAEDDPSIVQFKDLWCWDVEENSPNPGQAVTLRKFDPIDLLQIPEKASTRAQVPFLCSPVLTAWHTARCP
jgi:hypothetical protein